MRYGKLPDPYRSGGFVPPHRPGLQDTTGSNQHGERKDVRNLARMLPTIGRSGAQAIIVLSPSADVPAELSNHATVLEWSLPDREEIARILDAAIDALPVGENDEMTWHTQPRAHCKTSGWEIGFTGRTQRDAIMSGEMPFIAA